jgi:hypothetical protein
VALAGAQVLAGDEEAGDAFRLWLNLDLERSNLTSSPDWPILLSNLVDRARAGLPGALSVNSRVGDVLEWRRADDAHDLRLEDPEGLVLPGRGGRVVGFEARRPGIHRVLAGDAELGRFSVNFVDPAESDLSACATEDTPPTAAPTEPDADVGTGGGGRLERQALAVLLLLAMAADWWVLRRHGRAAS